MNHKNSFIMNTYITLTCLYWTKKQNGVWSVYISMQRNIYDKKEELKKTVSFIHVAVVINSVYRCEHKEWLNCELSKAY